MILVRIRNNIHLSDWKIETIVFYLRSIITKVGFQHTVVLQQSFSHHQKSSGNGGIILQVRHVS